MAEAEGSPRSDRRSDALVSLVIFGAVALGMAALYLASAWLFADLSVFRGADGQLGAVPLARFNGALCLVFAYVCAAFWLGQRWVRDDFEALRGVVEAESAEWQAWAERIRRPGGAGLVRAALLGAAVGLGVDGIGNEVAKSPIGVWSGHVAWVWILNPLLFLAMGMLVWASVQRSRIYQELGRRARVQVGEIAPLAPFVHAGLRVALLWFLGTSLACLLLVDTDAPFLVIAVLAGTAAIGAASLLAPSRGVHERLRAAKQAELDWLHRAIARSTDALRRGDTAGAQDLPALLAWEARVRGAPEWPFDASTWLRFAVLLLVPLGSWLGGALVELLVDRWLAA